MRNRWSYSSENSSVGSGFTTLIIFNEEMNDIMKISKSLKESGLLMKGIKETIKNEAKNKQKDFSECY